jgi:hypothetical protein
MHVTSDIKRSEMRTNYGPPDGGETETETNQPSSETEGSNQNPGDWASQMTIFSRAVIAILEIGFDMFLLFSLDGLW